MRTSLPSESTTENLTSAVSERSKPTKVKSRKPSPLGEKSAGTAAKRITSGNSLLSCCATKKAANVASTSAANTARTRGLAMRGENGSEPLCPHNVPPCAFSSLTPAAT